MRKHNIGKKCKKHSANMFDSEIQPSKFQIMYLKTKGCGVIITNIMTRNGA